MPTEGVKILPSGKKSFIPLENNPEVFTSLVHDLGVSEQLGFYDVYNLDEPELLALIPRPALALIFITPPDMYYAVRGEDGIGKFNGELTYDKSGDDEPVMWFQQTIGNACGLMALIHSISNGEAKKFVQSDSLLDRIIKQATHLKPTARAAALYDNEELEKAHMRAAVMGSSAPPPAEEHAGLHFIAFVRGEDGHLWELEGGVDGPIDRGALGKDDDVLSERALDQGVKKFLKHSNGNLQFSIVALAKEQ